MKTIDAMGKVFFPNDDIAIQGAKLFTIEKGVYLEFDFPRSDSHRDFDIILGVFNGLGLVTCLNNVYYGSHVGGGGNICRYKVINLFTGVHFNSKTDIKFNKAFFSVNSLLEWFDKVNIKLSYKKPITTIEYGTFQKIPLEIIGFENSSFNFGYASETSKHSLSVRDTVALYLDTKNPKDLDSIFDVIIKLKKLFAFLSSYSFDIEDITLYNSDYKYEFGGKQSDSLVDIKLFNPNESIAPLPTSHFLNIRYIDIEEIFTELISRWLKVSENNFVIDLLMEKSFNPELSIKTYFLNICFALEVYHKNNINNQKFTTQEFNRIKNYLKHTIQDPTVKKWIENKLGNGNFPSFRDRLGYFDGDIKKIYNSDTDLLINKIINTRNSLVHSTAKRKFIIKNDSELYDTSLILETIVKRYILKDLGIPEENLQYIDKEAKTRVNRHMTHTNKTLNKPNS
jgi:hypothetical protein